MSTDELVQVTSLASSLLLVLLELGSWHFCGPVSLFSMQPYNGDYIKIYLSIEELELVKF